MIALQTPTTRPIAVQHGGEIRHVFRVAMQPQEVTNAWRLVYQVYRRRGMIGVNPNRIHTAPQWMGQHTAVFYGRDDRGVVATLTATVDEGSQLPLDKVYGVELDLLRSQGRRLVECGLFAHARLLDNDDVPEEFEDLRGVGGSLCQLMRYAYYFGIFHGATDFLIGVHPWHAGFYRRAFGFSLAGSERTYPLVNNRPVVLMRANHAAVREANPRPWAMAYVMGKPLAPRAFCNRFILRSDQLGAPEPLLDCLRDDHDMEWIA